MGCAVRVGCGFQQQLIAIGVAGVAEDRDAVAVAGLLEDREDAVSRGISLDQNLAEPGLLGGLQGIADAVYLLGKASQVVGRIDPVVGVDQQNDG